MRLSSKSHWDVPVRVGGETVHYLVWHPTPPTFDGAEDRNGLRNADEIRFWVDDVRPGRRGDWMVDDQGREGGLTGGTDFVVAGDQNSDPNDGDSVPGAIQQLLDHRRLQRRRGAGQPARRLRPAAPGDEGDRDRGVLARQADPLSRLTGTFPFPTSDHRAVWVDLRP